MSDGDTNIAGYLVLVLRTILVMTLCSQYLRGVAVPVPRLQGRGLGVARVKVFSLFPILLTILLMWLLCALLTAAGAFSPTNGARTDTHLQLLHRADWFRFPYPREAARLFRGGKNIT